MTEKECRKELSKYWIRKYAKYDNEAAFGTDKETIEYYSWFVEIPGREFEIRINKKDKSIREIKKH